MKAGVPLGRRTSPSAVPSTVAPRAMASSAGANRGCGPRQSTALAKRSAHTFSATNSKRGDRPQGASVSETGAGGTASRGSSKTTRVLAAKTSRIVCRVAAEERSSVLSAIRRAPSQLGGAALPGVTMTALPRASGPAKPSAETAPARGSTIALSGATTCSGAGAGSTGAAAIGSGGGPVTMATPGLARPSPWAWARASALVEKYCVEPLKWTCHDELSPLTTISSAICSFIPSSIPAACRFGGARTLESAVALRV